MSKKFKNLFRVLSLLVLLASFVPLNHAALAAANIPPLDMFQLPWEQGKAWVALDGFDNGSDRALGSPHNYRNGGAIDFAPHNNMIKGENTSNFWVTAAAAGTIVEISKCHMKIAHASGWVTEYQHLANLQVKLGDAVARNQKLAIIANASTQPVCAGSEPPDIPHLHFVLRPNMVGATFAGWEFRYNSLFNSTTFRKGTQTVGLFKPLLNVLDVPPTATPTVPSTATQTPTAPAGPYVSTSVNLPSIDVGAKALASVSLNNVPSEGYASAEFTCTYNANLVEVTNIVVTNLFGADAVSVSHVPQAGTLIVAIAGSNGNKATTSGTAFTFDARGLLAGQTALGCTARVSKGDNVLTDLPSIGTDLTVLGNSPSPTASHTSIPGGSTPTFTATPTITATSPTSNWLTFTNSTFGYQFQYPPQGQIRPDSTPGDTIITNLPIVQSGTNLVDKYLEVAAGANATECKSLFQTQDPGVTVTINGISFLKQTGAEGAAGSLYQWVAYSTLRNGVCVSMNFILRSHDPSVFPTPPPVFDYAAETALFGQIVETYAWLAQAPTATHTSTPIESPTPTSTSTLVESPTPIESPTPTITSTSVFTATPTAPMSPTPSGGNGAINGQVTASKQVVINVYDAGTTPVATLQTQPNGSFQLEVAPGNYTVVASAPGFLSAQAAVPSLNPGVTRFLPSIALLAGDIDGNNAVDQFDALTIGMSYNASAPAAADLNNDGIINVLDLELLAGNYRETGPVVWQ